MVEKAGKFGIFLACSRYPDCDNTKELEPAEAPTEELEETCENCGRPMVAKRGRFGMFLACTGYPECKTTRKIIATKQGVAAAKPDQMLDEMCPNCGKNLVLKQGRFGEFTACTGYPECKYVKQKTTGVDVPEGRRRRRRAQVAARQGVLRLRELSEVRFHALEPPVPEPCPKCGWPFLTEKITKRHGRQLICANEACDYVRSAELEETRRRLRYGQWCPTSSVAGWRLEAAWQAASLGVPVTLHEMRPGARDRRAHRPTAGRARVQQLLPRRQARQRRRPAERGDATPGLARHARGRPAYACRPAPRWPSIASSSREGITRAHCSRIRSSASSAARSPTFPHPTEMSPLIMATGPLTSPTCRQTSPRFVGHEHLAFFDAISPIVLAETIDSRKCSGRRGGIAVSEAHRIPSSTQTDEGRLPELSVNAGASTRRFTQQFVAAEKAAVHDFDNTKFFEGCLPIEVMAHRGHGHAAVRPDETRGSHRSPDGPLAVRRRPAPPGHARRRPLQPGGLSDAAEVGRAGSCLPDDSRSRTGGVRTLRDDSPEHVHQRANRAVRDVADALASRPVLRRPGFRRRGLRRVSGLRAGRRPERGAARLGPARRRRRRARRRSARSATTCLTPTRALRSVEHHVRHHAAAR